MLSERVKKVNPSITLQISAKAKEMKKEGIDVISFGAGEPDFDTPDFIKTSAIESIKEGKTKYTPASGLVELKEAVVDKFKKDNNLDYNVDNIIISCGAKHSLYNTIQALVNPGDEVIIFSPYWVTYPEQVKLASGTPVIIPTADNGFEIDIDKFKSKLSEKTKLIIINSPQNPTGYVYKRETLDKIAEAVLEYDNLFVISDEIYEKIIFDGQHHFSIAELGDEIKKRTIVINGMSKSYSMTGWRIGYLAADKEIASAISKIQSQSTSNPTTFCQTASITALKADNKEIMKMVKSFSERREIIYKLLSEIDNIEIIKPDGAFYIFPKISYYYGKKIGDTIIDSSIKFAEVLLNEEKVAIVPGAAFGCDEYIRLSFATSVDNITKGVNRIKNFIKKLK